MAKKKLLPPPKNANLMHFVWYLIIVVLPLFGPMFLFKQKLGLNLWTVLLIIIWQNLLIWMYHIFVTPKYHTPPKWVLTVNVLISLVLYALWLGLI